MQCVWSVECMWSVGTLFGCINALNFRLRLCFSGPLPICAHVRVILVSWAEGRFPASGSTYMPCAGTLECMTHSKDNWRRRTAHFSAGNKSGEGSARGQFAGHATAWKLLNRINPDCMAEAIWRRRRRTAHASASKNRADGAAGGQLAGHAAAWGFCSGHG